VAASRLPARGNARSLRFLLVAVGAGLAIGIATSVAQGSLPQTLTPLSNSTGTWCLGAFALALLERDPRRAALIGFASLIAMLAGYALATELRGFPVGTSMFGRWGAAAVIAGPALGIGAAWLRGPAPLRAAAGVAPIAGILLGGYGGAWLHPADASVPFASRPLTEAGATLGVGIVVVVPASSCGIAETARIARYMAGESAGQCGPCVFGLPAIADDLELLAAGRGDAELLARLDRRCGEVAGRGACRHPDGVVRLVRSALDVFAGDVRDHATGHACAGHRASTVLQFPSAGSARVGAA